MTRYQSMAVEFHRRRHSPLNDASPSPSHLSHLSNFVNLFPEDITTYYASSSSSSQSLFRRAISLAVLLFIVSFSCLVIYRAALSNQNLTLLSAIVGSPNVTAEYRLKQTLLNAATEDKTIILTTLNEAWAAPDSVFDLFLASFKFGNGTEKLLNHLVVIALDEKAFNRCLAVHTHCFALSTNSTDFSKEAFFMTSRYLRMMWRRIDFLRSILEMGFSFVFTDADVMWFRDPFPHFHLEVDFQIACDHFVGRSDDLENIPNGGFSYARSNNRSIEFYRFWYSSQENYPGYHDQDVLNFIKRDPHIMDIGLKMSFLDTAYFGGLCEPSRDLNHVCTMHANCCVGLNSKIHDLKIMLQDWRLYMSLPPNLKQLAITSWTVPQKCSLSVHHDEPLANAPAPDMVDGLEYSG